MDVGAPVSGPFSEVALGQLGTGTMDVTPSFERPAKGVEWLKRGYGHLDVDDRLRIKAGNRGRTNVVDPERDVAELGAKPPRHVIEEVWPLFRIRHDNDALSHAAERATTSQQLAATG
jgi:hypothetical protein